MGSGIYYILNILDGKIYIGSAVSILSRWRVHRHLLRNGKHFNKHLQRAWKRDGEDALIFGVLEYLGDKSILLEREQYWIDYYESYNELMGYNLLPKKRKAK
jgi:group I intron endonuclease